MIFILIIMSDMVVVDLDPPQFCLLHERQLFDSEIAPLFLFS